MGDLTPITREEYYLARMAGEDVTMPEPITREEEYMKGIAAQIEAGSAELPAVTDVDEGKILAVNASGKWDKADAPTELPAVTDVDKGKLLSVNANGEWDKVDAPSTNVFDIFFNSTGTTIGTKTGTVSTEAITLSIPLSGEMDYAKTFKGIVTISGLGPAYRAKYLIYKFLATGTLGVTKLYEWGPLMSNTNFTITGGQIPSVPATAFNIELTASGSGGAPVSVTLYSV